MTQIHWKVNPIRWESWNDEISSFKLLAGAVVAFYQHENFGGNRLLVFGSKYVPDLSDIGWNDTISSIRIVPVTPGLDLERTFFPG